MDSGRESRLGTLWEMGSNRPCVVVMSVIFGCRDVVLDPMLTPILAARCFASAVSSSAAGAAFRFRGTGGALGSLGFLGRLTFSPSSGCVLLRFAILDPGLGPGFLRGKPSLVSMGWPDPSYRIVLGSTTISSPSPPFLIRSYPFGDVGPDRTEGGSDNSGDELNRIVVLFVIFEDGKTEC